MGRVTDGQELVIAPQVPGPSLEARLRHLAAHGIEVVGREQDEATGGARPLDLVWIRRLPARGAGERT